MGRNFRRERRCGVGDDDSKIPEHQAEEVADFFDANSRWLFGHASFRTSWDQKLAASWELAEDLVQDVFEAAAGTWETLRELEPAQQRAWLRTTLRYITTSDFRRRQQFRDKQPELYRRYCAAEADTEEQALSALALARAAAIIKGLPGNQKRIALMKWDDQMKGAEIAAELGCAEGTVAAQVHEIRRKLIEGLGPYYPFARDDEEGEAS
jgi:RNA polymerase sigma-70 factor, ECF subfamily